ncbi:MAG: bifunctional folylpolyglutamate synthase/dihydrofolate synthase [Alistipes sp.]|nr:bifunctional folylpolyglutamate synthase/dihydrofolate synthase [Alistipes sp.]
MNYTQTLEYLFSSLRSFQDVGADAYKPGLERVAEFCRHLGNPQRNYYTIHIAGTNGKGSVSHILASVLREAGYCVGLYTSPHLKDFRERIKVDGQMISKQRVVNFVDKHKAKMEALGLSFFEMTAAMAFDHFAYSDVEVAVIETGLGGRLDATNIITPIVSVVTNVGLDHTDLLGETLREIAVEKAGIIKKSVPLVLGERDDEYNDVFESVAAAVRSKVIYAEDSFRCVNHHCEGECQRLELERQCDGRMYDIELDLTGDYQRRNAVTAAAVVHYLHDSSPLTISRRAFVEGFAKAARSTGLEGRWQTIGHKPLVVCDTGHNSHGINYVASMLKCYQAEYGKQVCVIGFVREKSVDEILAMLPKEAYYIFTQATISRAMPADEVAERATAAGLQGEVMVGVKEAIARAKEIAGEEDMIFVGGSTFVVAEAL